MKHIISLFIFCIISVASSAQVEVSKILKPSNGQCNGTIIFDFIASEIPGTLVMLPDDQSLDGGNISIDGTSYTLKNVCPGNYTFTFIDNHGCKESEYVELEECGEESFDFNVETEVVDCNFDTPFSIYPDFDNHTDYYFEWSTASIEHFIENVSAGDYTVTMTDSYGCSHIEQKSVNPLNPEDYASDFEIIPTKIAMATGYGGENLGEVVIVIEGGGAPYQIEWSSSDPTVINTIAEDQLSISLNFIDFYSDIVVSVIDKYGCKLEKEITLETCVGIDQYDFKVWFDPFETKYCSEAIQGEITMRVLKQESFFINYNLVKILEGGVEEIVSSGVIKPEQDFVTINYYSTGTYIVTLTDECGFVHTEEINLNCYEDNDCSDYTFSKILKSQDRDDSCDEEFKVRFIYDLDLAINCQEDPSFEDFILCNVPIQFLIKYPDGGIYKVSVDEDYKKSFMSIVPSSPSNVQDTYDSCGLSGCFGTNHDYLIVQPGMYTFELSFDNGCSYYKKFDNRQADSEYTTGFSMISKFDAGPNSLLAQSGNTLCETCKYPLVYPTDLIYPPACNTWDFVPYNFHPNFPPGYVWNPEDGTNPFNLGGNFKVRVAPNEYQNVKILPGTPYIVLESNEGLPEHSGDEWIRCIYQAGSAIGPAYSDFPIYVGYSADHLNSLIGFTFEPPVIMDEECDDESITFSSTFCSLDVVCYDDFPPTVIGTIPDIESLLPCKLVQGNDCIVVGYCTESMDYYKDQNDDYFVYASKMCDDNDVIECDGTTNEETPSVDCNVSYPCPDGEFCKFNICRDCPTFTYTGLYGNNYDCVYNFEFEVTVSVVILAYQAKVYLIDENNNEIYLYTTTLSGTPGGFTNNVNVTIPPGCDPYQVKMVLQYKNCPIETIISSNTNTAECQNDCFQDDNSDSEDSYKQNEDSDINKRNELKNNSYVEQNCILSPNPFTNNFEINSNARLISDFLIINSLGEHIKSEEKIYNQNIHFNLSNYPAGLYFIKVTLDDNSTELLKAIKI
jgi:hypothetical protein